MPQAIIKDEVLRNIVRAVDPLKVRELTGTSHYRFQISRVVAAAIAMEHGFYKDGNKLDLERAVEYTNHEHPRSII